MSQRFLDRAYGVANDAETRQLYDDWSASYDAEVAENGYATPARCADALARHLTDRSAPILDFGCGTGLSGLALRAAGFDRIDGVDPSAGMLDQARVTGAYRNLTRIAPDEAAIATPGIYAAIAAIGVIGAGAAPITVFDRLIAALGPGGRLVFSFNDHALADPPNLARLSHWTASDQVRVAEMTYGDHLPGIDLKSMVYVLVKK